LSDEEIKEVDDAVKEDLISSAQTKKKNVGEEKKNGKLHNDAQTLQEVQED